MRRLLVLLVVMTLVGTAILLVAAFSLREWNRAKRYVCTKGLVLSSRVEKATKLYAPVVSYRYTVNGTLYSGDTVTLSMWEGRGDKEWAELIARSYRVGDPCDVYYDPLDPQSSALRITYGSGHWTAIGLAFLMAALVSLAIGGAIRRLYAYRALRPH